MDKDQLEFNKEMAKEEAKQFQQKIRLECFLVVNNRYQNATGAEALSILDLIDDADCVYRYVMEGR